LKILQWQPNVPTILRGGRVVDPVLGLDEVTDVAFARGRITQVGSVGEDAQVIDVQNYVITPGLIDMHVHLRDPGQTEKEDISSGTLAAAVGGFSRIVAMPNTDPPVDSAEHLSRMLPYMRKNANVKIEPTVTLTMAAKGEAVSDLRGLRRKGASAATDDGRCIQGSAVMFEVLQCAKDAGIAVLDHCEDVGISRHASLNAGDVAQEKGVGGQSPAAEEVMVARDIVLARTTGYPVHIQHVSTAGSVELIRWAKQQGIRVSAEATPHHLSLTEEAIRRCGTYAKVNPPLRTEADRQEVIRGVRDGTISVIATDHAPHTRADKDGTVEEAAFGIAGLESAIPVSLSCLYHEHGMPLIELVAAFTQGPREVLGLDAGTLAPGAPADITILAPDKEVRIDSSRFHSKASNSPFHGNTYKGAAAATVVDGMPVRSG